MPTVNGTLLDKILNEDGTYTVIFRNFTRLPHGIVMYSKRHDGSFCYLGAVLDEMGLTLRDLEPVYASFADPSEMKAVRRSESINDRDLPDVPFVAEAFAALAKVMETEIKVYNQPYGDECIGYHVLNAHADGTFDKVAQEKS
jgi:hypothetical protein